MSFIKFVYNRSVHFTINYSSFEIVYGFNPLTPLIFFPLPINERVSLNVNRKENVVKTLHENVKRQIHKKKNEQYAFIKGERGLFLTK